jgi:hypothetical protein
MEPKQLMKAVADTLKNENCAILIASKDGGTITQCAMVGNNDEVIANLTVALTIALGSIKDPVQRLQTKQTVSTAIMTKDVDLDALKKKGEPQ